MLERIRDARYRNPPRPDQDLAPRLRPSRHHDHEPTAVAQAARSINSHHPRADAIRASSPGEQSQGHNMKTPLQPELPLGEHCPEHGPQARTLSPTPVGGWNSHADEVRARYRDMVYQCRGRSSSRPCSWAWSIQIGVFVPAGLPPSSFSYPAMYHEKRFRPAKWERRHARRTNPAPDT